MPSTPLGPAFQGTRDVGPGAGPCCIASRSGSEPEDASDGSQFVASGHVSNDDAGYRMRMGSRRQVIGGGSTAQVLPSARLAI